MSKPYTTNWVTDWDTVATATRGVSHRSTTSSRRPGKAIEGSVSYGVSRIVICLDCGSHRHDLGGPHSPHFNNAGQLIDCAGRLLPRGTP